MNFRCRRFPHTNNPNPRSAIGDNRGPMFVGNCANHQVSLLENIFGAENDVLRSPDHLGFDKINPVLGFVALALLGIELEFHELFRI